MEDKIEVKWTYSPGDFFEEPFIREYDGYKIEICNGTALLHIDSNLYEEDEEIINKISKEIEDFFYGGQIVGFKKFKISLGTYTITKYKPNGTQDTTIAVSSMSAYTIGESVDIKTFDDEGRILADTKAKKISEQQEVALLARKYRRQDEVAKSILNSYRLAIEFPNYQLSHFYDIRDALRRKFENEKGIRDYLNVSENQLKRLRILANREPLIEGRKRGNHVGKLRHATSLELDEARRIAKQLVLNYLRFLDSENIFKQK